MRTRRIAPWLAIALALAIGPQARAQGWRDRLGQDARLEALRAPDPARRRDAARWLGRHGDGDGAVPALIEQLEAETDPDARVAIAESLGRRGDPRATLALGSPVGGMRAAEREARLRALAAIDAPEARRALAESLASAGATFARALAIDAGAPMIDALAPLLAVPAAAVAAAEVIGAIGDARGAEALAERADDPEPALRAAVIDALGAIGDPRFAEPVRAALDDADPAVVAAALRALARVGSVEDGVAVEVRIESEGAVATAAWRALCALDPARAAARAVEPRAAEAAREAMLELPHVALIEPLMAIARADARGSDALARITDDAGARALVDLARDGAPGASLALALAMRHGRSAAGARETLSREPDPLRRAWLLAIARDAGAPNALGEVSTEDPIARALRARAVGLSGGADPSREAAIARETDPVALEALARAHVDGGGSIDAELVLAIREPGSIVARAILASIARPSGSAEVDREIVRSLHRIARSRAPRPRAAAIEGLARRGEGATTIAAAIEDLSAEVRLAAARALAAMADRPVERLASRLAVEPDARVRRALRDAIAGRSAPRGEQCLVVQLARSGPPESIVVELVLDDGRWLRERTAPGGELVLCGLADGSADVRLPP